MTDIRTTINLDGAYLSIPSVPANGQEGTPSNNMAFVGTLLTKSLVITDDMKATLFIDSSIAGLPPPFMTYYNLAATLSINNL